MPEEKVGGPSMFETVKNHEERIISLEEADKKHEERLQELEKTQSNWKIPSCKKTVIHVQL